MSQTKGSRKSPRSDGADRLRPVRNRLPVITQRERDVIACLVRGHRNDEIARALRITRSTVQTHLRSVFGKLRVNNRTAALTEAVRLGIVKF